MRTNNFIKRTVLPNGVVVISENVPGYESTAVGLYMKSGSAHEGENHNGLAHFFEHIVFKGTESRSALEISKSIEDKGGEFNAYTSQGETCFYAHTSASEFATAVKTICEMINLPKIDPVDVKNEKGVILEEARMYMDIPDRVVGDLYEEALWGSNTELGRRVIGTISSIKKIGVNDLVEYHERVLSEVPMVVAASGKVDHSELVKMVRAGLSRKTGVVKSRIISPNFMGAFDKTKRMSVNQACVQAGTFVHTENERQRVALSIVRNIMGGGMSSRLFQTVREKMGLVYGIRAYTETYDRGIGFGVGYKAEPNKAVLAFEAMVDEIGKMKKEGFGKDEILRAKDSICGQARLTNESALNRMMIIGERELNGRKVMGLSELVRRTESITAKEVGEVVDMIGDIDDWAYAAVVPNGWRGKIRK